MAEPSTNAGSSFIVIGILMILLSGGCSLVLTFNSILDGRDFFKVLEAAYTFLLFASPALVIGGGLVAFGKHRAKQASESQGGDQD